MKTKLNCHIVVLGFLLSASFYAALAEERPAVSVDLIKNGLPKDFYKSQGHRSCITPYMGYQAIQWLDAERVLVMFNTSAQCPNTDKPHAPGTVRLVLLGLNGDLLRTADFAYVAGIEESVPHDGLWIGPDKSILIEFPHLPAAGVPNSNGKVRVLNQNLESIQEIETESDETTKQYKVFTHYGIHFEGATRDHQGVVFSKETENGHEGQCLMYTGIPLKQTSECSAEELSLVKAQLQDSGSYPVAKGYEPHAEVAGNSIDGSRSSVFVIKKMVCVSLRAPFVPPMAS